MPHKKVAPAAALRYASGAGKMVRVRHDPVSWRAALRTDGHWLMTEPFDGAVFLDEIDHAMGGSSRPITAS